MKSTCIRLDWSLKPGLGEDFHYQPENNSKLTLFLHNTLWLTMGIICADSDDFSYIYVSAPPPLSSIVVMSWND